MLQPLPDVPDESADESGAFGKRVKSAVFWRSGSQIVAQVITWGSTLLVIRLLDPADYGLFAMSQVILAFLGFLNGYGFASALIQERDVTPFRLRQAFGLLLLLNGAIALIQWLAAPAAAAYFRQPVIADMLRVQVLIFLATPFITLPEVMMSRQLDFRRQAAVNMVAAIVGAGTALGGASAGWGVWTLVIAPIAMFWTRAIGLTLTSRILVLPTFNFTGCGDLLKFGGALLGSHMLWLVQTQSDVFLAGHRFEPRAIGLYAEALFLTQIFVAKFVPPLNEVAFPAYARIQHEPSALRYGFLKAIRLVAVAAMPFYAGLAVVAHPLIELAFGTKWLPMADFVVILCGGMAFNTLYVLIAPATNAMGRPGVTLRASAVGAILFPTAFYIGMQIGPIGLAWAWLITAPLLLLVGLRLARPVLGLGARAVLGAAARPAIAALVMAGVVWLAGRVWGGTVPLPLDLALRVAVGALTYPVVLWVIARPLCREILMLLPLPARLRPA